MARRSGVTPASRRRSLLLPMVQNRSCSERSQMGLGGQASPCSRGQRPSLVGAPVAVPELELGTRGGAGVGVVEAPAGGGVDELAGGVGLPLLVAPAVAGPELDQAAVGGAVIGDVQAALLGLQGAVGLHRPVLRGGAVAGGGLDTGTVGGAAA